MLGPVAVAGALTLAAAGRALALDPPSAGVIAGIAICAAAATLAEAFPVPMVSFPSGTISVSTVFVVAAAPLFGWAAASVCALLARALVEAVQQRPRVKLVYNSALYTLSGAGAGAGAALGGLVGGVPGLFLGVAAGAVGFYVVNIPLVVAVVARAAGEPYLPMLRRWTASTAASFAVMASISLMIDGLWQRSPALTVAVVGPLAAVVLYQRSAHRAVDAMRLALTDALTGLGNHRHFHDDLQRALDEASERAQPLSLCVLDLDDFKQINDSRGHPFGDLVLEQVAGCLRSGGEAFRLGGDEFALLLPGHDADAARAVGDSVLARLGALEPEPGLQLTFSAGIATYPVHAEERSELLRVADVALYVAKRRGKNRLHVAEPSTPALAAAG